MLGALILDALQPRRKLKAHPALGPFLKLGSDIFGDKDNLRGAADEIALTRIGLGNNKRKDRGPIRRGDRHPAVTGLKPGIKGQMEAQLIEVETQTSILIAHENVNAMQAKV